LMQQFCRDVSGVSDSTQVYDLVLV
jgi:hypothetical protein